MTFLNGGTRRAGRMATGVLAWLWTAIERHAAAAVMLVAAATVYTGLTWGTFAAGGSDSYCYLNQAEVFARGGVVDVEPLATDPAWPGSPEAFVPAGHHPSPQGPGVFVPICPAGYSLLLAGAHRVGGRSAMFWVTPLMGGVLVVFAFVIGRQLAGPAAGLFAALLTASSPIVLYQVVQPMNDVPAAALWAAAIAAALRERGAAVLAGALTGAAITIRPNLVPLAAVVGLITMWRVSTPNSQLPTPKARRFERPHLTMAIRTGLVFCLAAVPGVLVVMAVQQAMHGSPLRSGYGDLSALFSSAHVLPNLALYPQWVLEVHTPFILLALGAPVALHARARQISLWLLLFAAATLACYLPYVVFDAWWYQRFLLPAVAPLLALTAAVAVGALRPLPPWARTIVFIGTAAALTITYVQTASARGVFGLRDFEARFRTAGAYVAALEPHAVVITTHHSGSVRFYAGRSTAAWDGIAPGRLSDALAFFEAHGRRPYLLLETWEQPAFRERFASDPLGSLEWPPMVEIDRTVRIYDPADHARYMRGERVRVERIRSVIRDRRSVIGAGDWGWGPRPPSWRGPLVTEGARGPGNDSWRLTRGGTPVPRGNVIEGANDRPCPGCSGRCSVACIGAIVARERRPAVAAGAAPSRRSPTALAREVATHPTRSPTQAPPRGCRNARPSRCAWSRHGRRAHRVPHRSWSARGTAPRRPRARPRR